VMEVGGENDLGMLCICIKIAGWNPLETI
jgi:hypothetical protein